MPTAPEPATSTDARVQATAPPPTPGQQELLDAWAAAGHPEHDVVISDGHAIRALAHEARQEVINFLFSEQKPYTSTQLAELTELTPSAMSYHLRALEKWGVVERVDVGSDGRNRPWRAAGTGLRIIGRGEANESALEALRTQMFDALNRRARRSQAQPPEERVNHVTLSLAEVWVDEEQSETLSQLLDRALLQMTRAGWTNEPGEGRTRMAYLFSLLPDPYGTDPPRPTPEAG